MTEEQKKTLIAGLKNLHLLRHDLREAMRPAQDAIMKEELGELSLQHAEQELRDLKTVRGIVGDAIWLLSDIVE